MAAVAEDVDALRGMRPASLKDLLGHPSFSRLWRAMLVSSLGDWVGFVAVASLVTRLEKSQSASLLAVAGVMLARLLPSVLFGPFAGVLVDRFNRKQLMIAADIARGALYASMPFMPALWGIFALSFLIECLSLLWTPAKDASLPNLVSRRDLPNANSVGLVTTYGTLPLGGALYTLLAGAAVAIGTKVHYLGAHPPFLALWLDALTFLFSARMVWGIDLSRAETARLRHLGQTKLSPGAALEEAKEGFRFLRRETLVRAMSIGIVMDFAGVGSVIALGPIFAGKSLNSPSTGFGILVVALGVGMGVGMASMGWLTRFVDKEHLFVYAMLGAAGCLVVLAAMPTLVLAAVFAVPMGAGVGLTWVTGYTMIQENVADEFRGRTFASLNVAARMALFLALVAFPAVAAAIGSHFIRVGGRVFDFSGTRDMLWAAAGVVVAAGMITRKGLRRSRLARPRPLTLVPRVRRVEGSGQLIAFEGVEGAGKGTQIERARDYLSSKGVDVVVTREPGGTELGDRVREAILDPRTGTMDPRAEALLFAASRAHLVTTVIRPALAEGKVVLCDRFVDSSVAYQGVARGLGEQDVVTLNAWATQGLFPDLVLLLHLEPEQGLARAGADGTLDRIEGEDLAFHAKVADAYLRIADEHPERFVVIDASGTVDDVASRIRPALDRFFAENGGLSAHPASVDGIPAVVPDHGPPGTGPP